MATDTIIMVVLICVGSGMAIAGLGVAGYRVRKLVKGVRASQVASKAQVQQITGRVQRLGPRLRELDAKQRAVTEKLESISATAQMLTGSKVEVAPRENAES